MSVALICVGPTGVGYFGEVAELPTQDRGVFATRHGAFLVCDAAIVAYICARRFPGHVHLITNNLGSVELESRLMRSKLEPGVTVHPDSSPFSGAPIDMIFIDREGGTRSYVTTDYFPSTEHILRSTRGVYESLLPKSRNVLYVDVEAGSESGKAALGARYLHATEGSSVWNVGQVANLSEAAGWLSGAVLPERAIIQVSLGNSMVTTRELRSAYQEIASAADQTLVVTLGSTGAAWADEQHDVEIAVDPVTSAFTLGAGAVFASSLMLSLAAEESPSVDVVVSDAVSAATRYVREATSGGGLLGLEYW